MSEQDQNTQNEQAHFSVDKIYVKDLSLEVPHGAPIFLEQEAPEVEMNIRTDSQSLNDGYYECSLIITVTAKLKDGRIVFLNEVTQSGIFQIVGLPEEDLQLLVGIAAPNILFPYARETVSNITTRAGFPPIVLAPINFEAMYYQTQAEKAKQKENAKSK